MEYFIKPSLMLGAICGLCFGIILLIPVFAPFMFFLVFLIAGILVIVFLKRTNSIGIITLQNGSIIGALAGFSSLIATAIVYLPSTYLIGLIFKSSSQSFGINQTISSFDILAISMLVFFVATLSAVMNAFTGMATAYLYEKTEQKPLNFQEHFEDLTDLEQVDHTID